MTKTNTNHGDPIDIDKIVTDLLKLWQDANQRSRVFDAFKLMPAIEAFLVGHKFIAKLDERSKQTFLSDLGRIAHEHRIGTGNANPLMSDPRPRDVTLEAAPDQGSTGETVSQKPSPKAPPKEKST